jgi:hypothetical protein
VGTLLKKQMPGVTRKAVLTMDVPEFVGIPPAELPTSFIYPYLHMIWYASEITGGVA